jgi:DNA polymerase-3 subunit beta
MILNITLTSNQVRFGSVVLVSKLIDGKFPDYERWFRHPENT